MNIHELDIMQTALEKGITNQRLLSNLSGYSLGKVNQTLKLMAAEGYLETSSAEKNDDRDEYAFTGKAYELAAEKSPKRAVILAAGFGLRMSPMNQEIPKAFIQINGQRLIERLIEQLHEAGIQEIYIVVGFMKESFDYLIDRYGVKLIVNMEYKDRNNLFSLAKAVDKLDNCYVLACDLWSETNPFSHTELHSWYMISDTDDEDSFVNVNRKGELLLNKSSLPGKQMLDIAYITSPESDMLKQNIKRMTFIPDHSGMTRTEYDNCFWEHAAFNDGKMILAAKIHKDGRLLGINTYEQLRSLDGDSDQLRSDIVLLLADVLKCRPEDITNITLQKKGMTNRSFVFRCLGKSYIMRIPGEGTDLLINRAEEYDVYKTIMPLNLCDNVYYINPANGYKLSEFIDGVRCCDPLDESDLRICMKKLHDFHTMKLKVSHSIDLFGKIDYYEKLRGNTGSLYSDFEQVRDNVYSLRPFIEKMQKDNVLVHFDSVYDNFLLKDDKVYLIDWEYAGMQDPHIDIAMFSIYAFYDRKQIDHLINLYFSNSDAGCSRAERYKIYAYTAACGLLWSNWCEYKKSLGLEFGEYSLRQYRYAKDFYKIIRDEYPDAFS